MEEFAVFLVIVIALIWAVSKWPLEAAGIAALVGLGYLVQKIHERNKEAKRVRQHHADEQQAQLNKLLSLGDSSLRCFEDMPKHLMTTEELLDQADIDFGERAFAPFWDSVERAATHLGRFDESVRTLSHNAEKHKAVAARYERPAPAFPINVSSLKGVHAAKPSSERLRGIVRRAQKDFEFATIYEQRKTNQLLIAGFTNLAEALDGMGRRIASSIDDLSTKVSDISTSVNNMNSAIGENLAAIQSAASEHASAAIERHDKALAMLDNIQRRRKPRPSGMRDGEY